MPEVTITLKEADLMWLQEILMDEDEAAALEFLHKVIGAEVERRRKAGMLPPV